MLLNLPGTDHSYEILFGSVEAGVILRKNCRGDEAHLKTLPPYCIYLFTFAVNLSLSRPKNHNSLSFIINHHKTIAATS